MDVLSEFLNEYGIVITYTIGVFIGVILIKNIIKIIKGIRKVL
jgi:hypothetical protein